MEKIDQFLQRFFRQESAAGLLLMFTAALALLVANSPLMGLYNSLLDIPIAVQFADLSINKPLLLWVNDGLMAVFFFLIGLELKREILVGELKSPDKIALPAIGAVGGMLVPALIYVYFNYDDPVALQGWAIPAATDIAFALGILSLLGDRVPTSVKIFLTSLAIFDDVGAIIIIALFYTSQLSITGLIVALLCLIPLAILNRRGIGRKSSYIFFGLIMWVALLKSGVHATLAGVVLAGFIPMKARDGHSPLETLEHDLHHAVAFIILPIFAFCNAGVNVSGIGFEQLVHPIPLGIAAGLFLGKQIGIFSLCWLAVKTGLAKLPEGMGTLTLYAVSALCGVGFTMSLFIGSLAFEETGVNLLFDERLGIIIGSVLSGLMAFFVLKLDLKRRDQQST